MAKKTIQKRLKANPLSQVLIIAALIIVIIALFETNSKNDFTLFAPTQLFILAGVLGILGIYIKDEKL